MDRVRWGDRLCRGVILGLALAVLGTGGYWWRSSPPNSAALATSAPGSGVPAASGPAARRPPQWPVIDDVSTSDRRVWLDGETGEILAVELHRAEPGSPLVLHVPNSDDLFTELSSLLVLTGPGSEASGILWRERLTLSGGRQPASRWLRTERGGHYLLQYTCSGAETVLVELSGAGTSPSARPWPCRTSLSTVDLVAAGPLRLRLAPVDGRPVVVAAQVVAG